MAWDNKEVLTRINLHRFQTFQDERLRTKQSSMGNNYCIVGERVNGSFYTVPRPFKMKGSGRNTVAWDNN